MRSPRERFNPAVERCRFRVAAAGSRDALLGALREQSGWDAARVASVLRHGALFLDDRPHDASTLPEQIAAGVRVDAHAFAWEPDPIAIGRERILAETAAWLAADKPAFMTTQRSRASARLDLETALRSLTGCAGLAAVHRLDRETSGVVLFAKTREAAADFGRAFEVGHIAKRYIAVVSPPPQRDSWELRGFIGRVADPERFRFALRSEAASGFRDSHSRFSVLAQDGDRASVACEPLTGRTHQLRVHLAASGTPIVGDELYGGVPGDRTLLHAAELRLSADGEEIVLRAPMPVDFGTLAGTRRLFTKGPSMPSFAEIPWIAEHIALYRTDPEKARLWDSRPLGGPGVLPTLLLTTTGRTSGQPRSLPLIYAEAGKSYVVIASKGGMPTHPAWFNNLEADPRCELMVGAKRVTARARIAEGEERERLWKQLVALYPPYAEYQVRATPRVIPVVVLDPIG